MAADRGASAKETGGGPGGAATTFALDLDGLRGLLGYQLKLAQEKVYRSFADHLRELGLTPGHFGLLLVVGANPGLSQKALAEALGCNRSLIVRIVDQLQKQALVVRQPVPSDRRSYAILATRKGNRVIARLKGDVADHERRAAHGLNRHEQMTLLSLLRRLNAP